MVLVQTLHDQNDWLEYELQFKEDNSRSSRSLWREKKTKTKGQRNPPILEMGLQRRNEHNINVPEKGSPANQPQLR